MSRAAVFDLDGTLLRGTSAERLLLPFLIQRRVVGWRGLAEAAATASAIPVIGRTHALRRNKRYLAGAEISAVEELMDEFLFGRLEPRWHPDVRDRIRVLREEGRSLHLLTGAPDFVAQAVGRRFEMTSALGTSLEVREGRFTGRLCGPHWFGEQKRSGVLQLAAEWGLELAESVGFADHISDIPFLECFGSAVAVSPGTWLHRAAVERGWRVLA